MRGHGPPPIAIFLGGAGLIFLGVTMFLVLQVMRPQAVSFAEVQEAEKGKGWWWLPGTALRKWHTIIRSQQDLYLPCGVKSLTGLRQSMIIEEMTLVALSRATATARDPASCQKLCEAQAARAARLRELRAGCHGRDGRGVLHAAVPQQLGHLRRNPVRPSGDGGHRHCLRMAVALILCPPGGAVMLCRRRRSLLRWESRRAGPRCAVAPRECRLRRTSRTGRGTDRRRSAHPAAAGRPPRQASGIASVSPVPAGQRPVPRRRVAEGPRGHGNRHGRPIGGPERYSSRQMSTFAR